MTLPSLPRSEYGAVADDLDGRRAVGPARARDRPAGRPCSALQDAGEREGRRRPCCSRWRTLSASRSSSATVSARHSTTRADPTSCSRSASPGVAQGQHARVDEQAAVAIFGEARQAVDVRHLDAGRLQRLDERVGEPLRELVQRHEPARGVVRGHRRMAPAVAQGDAAELEARRPYAPEVAQQLGEDGRRGDRAIPGQRGQMIEQPTGTRRIGAREDLGFCRNRGAEPAQQGRAAVQARQRVGPRSPESGGPALRSVRLSSTLASARNGDARIAARMRLARTWRGSPAPGPPIGRPCAPVAASR